MRYAAYFWLFVAIYMTVTAYSGGAIDRWRLATAAVSAIAGALILWESRRRRPPKA
jgi:hypothetical protein